jgi:hypothetical protein
MPRRRWCWTPLAAWSRLRKRPQTEDDALPHPRRLLGGPVTAGQASPSLGRQLAAPGRGRGRLLHRHSARGTAARTLSRDLALRRLPTSQREATALTLFLDLGSGQAAATMRVSLATLRRCLAEAGQRPSRSAFKPLSASCSATGSVRRSARPAALRQGARRGPSPSRAVVAKAAA